MEIRTATQNVFADFLREIKGGGRGATGSRKYMEGAASSKGGSAGCDAHGERLGA